MTSHEPLIDAAGSQLLDQRSFGRAWSWLAAAAILGTCLLLGGMARALRRALTPQQRLIPVTWDIPFQPYTRCARVSHGVPHESYLAPLGPPESDPYFMAPWSVAALGLLAGAGRRHLRRQRWRRVDVRLARPSADAPLGQARDGQRVCVRGTVLPGPGFTSAAGRPRVVLASYLGSAGGLRARPERSDRRWELRGTDFSLGLDGGGGGGEVTVRVAGGTILGRPSDPPPGLFGGKPVCARPLPDGGIAAVHHEQVVAPGDVVEVSGVLCCDVAPDAEGNGREVRLRRTLVSRPGSRLVIHLVRAAGADVRRF